MERRRGIIVSAIIVFIEAICLLGSPTYVFAWTQPKPKKGIEQYKDYSNPGSHVNLTKEAVMFVRESLGEDHWISKAVLKNLDALNKGQLWADEQGLGVPISKDFNESIYHLYSEDKSLNAPSNADFWYNAAKIAYLRHGEELFTDDKQEDVSYASYLGRALHYVQDMTCPAHAEGKSLAIQLHLFFYSYEESSRDVIPDNPMSLWTEGASGKDFAEYAHSLIAPHIQEYYRKEKALGNVLGKASENVLENVLRKALRMVLRKALRMEGGEEYLKKHTSMFLRYAIEIGAGMLIRFYQDVGPTNSKPTVVSSLEITPKKDRYQVGDILTAEFTITNKGNASITFDVLTVGGRVNDTCPQDKCSDFDWKTDITLKPWQSYRYKGNLKLEAHGNYHFFTAYRTKDEWNTAISTEAGVTNVVDIEVIPPSSILSTSILGKWVAEFEKKVDGEHISTLEFREDGTLVSAMTTSGKWENKGLDQIVLSTDPQFFPGFSVVEIYQIKGDILQDSSGQVLTKDKNAQMIKQTTNGILWDRYMSSVEGARREIKLRNDGTFLSIISTFDKWKIDGDKVKVYTLKGEESPWLYEIKGEKIEVKLKDAPHMPFTSYMKASTTEAKEKDLGSVVVEQSSRQEPLLGGFLYISYDYDERGKLELKPEGYLTPLFIYENGKYRNFEEEFKIELKKERYDFANPTKAREVLEKFKNTKFWVYHRKGLTGEFKGSSLVEGEISVDGEIFWKIPKQEREITEEDLPVRAVVLSKPIRQQFWPKITLTSTQSQQLKKVIDLSLSTAFKNFKVNPKKYKTTHKLQRTEIMDLEQDGQPDIFLNLEREPIAGFGGEIGVSLLLSWRNNRWVTLLYGYYRYYGSLIAEGPFELMKEIGEGYISDLWPLDTNGDGTADIIVTQEPYEDVISRFYLYQIQKGQIKKILYLGERCEL